MGPITAHGLARLHHYVLSVLTIPDNKAGKWTK